MNMAKKGDVIISWVLLVGFVIGLAVIVTMWVKDRAEKQVGEQVDQAEQEMRCAETAVNIAMDCTNAPREVKLTNTGKFTIQKVKIRQGTFNYDAPLVIAPQQTQTETLNTNIDPLQPFDVLPIIAINEKEVVCATRKSAYKC